MKKNLIAIIVFFVPLILFSQNKEETLGHYFGNKKELGELEFLNDSMYRISFYFYAWLHPEYDTGFYRRSNDTVFLSSKTKSPFELMDEYYVQRDFIDHPERYPNVILPKTYLISTYRKGYKLSLFQKIIDPFFPKRIGKSREKHYMYNSAVFRRIGLDTVDNVLIYPYEIDGEYIIVIDGPIGIKRRIMAPTGWKSKGGMTFIKIMDSVYHRVYLNEFPLLVRGKKLKPCSDSANKKCLIENGFIFPEMSSKKPKHSRYYYCCSYRGLIGLIHVDYGREPFL